VPALKPMPMIAPAATAGDVVLATPRIIKPNELNAKAGIIAANRPNRSITHPLARVEWSEGRKT
jgi:hypothetical protein